MSRTNGVQAAVLAVLALVAPGLADVVDPPPEGSFTLVVMPDTQNYTIQEARREIFLSQTHWVAAQKDRFNIRYVLHEGDVVQDNIEPQWEMAKDAFSRLDDAGVPYAIGPGNHDYGPGGNGNGRNTGFNEPRFFGPGSPYASQPSVGGFFESGKTDNSYHLFSAGGRDWVLLALEWRPRVPVVRWADQVLTDHPDRTAIVVTHEYLSTQGTRNGTGNSLWSGLVSKHNVAFVFCGHVLGSGRTTSVGASGHVTHQVVANYQHLALGGNGYLRLVEILPDGRDVRILTYSPFLDALMESEVEQFELVACGVPEDTADVDKNRIPDACEPDCNGNGIPDAFEVRTGEKPDTNRNGTPDECDVWPAFSVDPTSGQEPLEVHVDASGSVTQEGHSIISYRWDYGDSTTGEGQTATHTYERAGAFTLSLTTTDDRVLKDTVTEKVSVGFRSEDVAPWSSADIGEPTFPGGARPDDSCLSIFAGGQRLRSRSDRYQFLHQELSDDSFVLTARLAETNAPTRSTFGLMVRESLAPDARYAAFVFRMSTSSVRFGSYHRSEVGEFPGWKTGERGDELGRWVRISRQGELLVGALSSDGDTWTEVEPVNLPITGTVLAGVVLSAEDAREDLLTVTVRVCDLELELSRPEFRRGDADASGQLELNDGIYLLNYVFLRGAAPRCLDAADADDNGRISIVDSITLFNFLFLGREAPPAPGPTLCAPDPTADGLDCASSVCP